MSPNQTSVKVRRKWKPPEIEDVAEAFCGIRRRKMVRLSDYDSTIASEWCYKKNCGWGPEDFSHASTVKAWWICPQCKREYKAQINNRAVLKSGCSYCGSKKVCDDNSFVVLYPLVAKEWHPKLNGKLKAEEMLYASSKMVWWRCGECRHEWQAIIADRTKLESGCPACYEARMEYARQHPPERKRGHIILGKRSEAVSRAWYESGRYEFTPLSKSHPAVAKLWHPTLNGKWTPKDFAFGSEAIAWWKCPKGSDHEWQSPIYARTSKRNSSCPFCSGRKTSVTNSLASKFPKVAKEWHPTLNESLTPKQVTAYSKKKAHWQCKANKDHVWETTIGLRARGSGCPYCSHSRPSSENNLKALFPEIAAEFHPTKNKGLKAEDIAPASSKKVWWKCRKARDHEWQATPANRTGRKSGCPCCTGKKVSVTNSLASVAPKIAAEWHKIKNGGFKPTDFTYGSSRITWWLCQLGHAWQQTISRRTLRKTGCPRCRKQGINSLEPPRSKSAVLPKREKIDFFEI